MQHIKDSSKQPDDLKKIRNRINWFCDNKVNAFSPTISPAPKSNERKEIESLLQGVKYYVENGVTDLVFQKKYMGSYCDIYLHKNPEETYFVSRNGHLIQRIDLEKAKAACAYLYEKFDWGNLNIVIIQSELMPWSVLGKGLIDNEFEGYLNAHRNHLNFLANSGIYKKVEKIKKGEAYNSFIKDREEMPSKQFKAKYPSHIIRQYSALEQFVMLDMDKYSESIEIYDAQIKHFGKEEEIYFKPFNVLKKIFDDGTEEILNDNHSYTLVNDDEMMTLTIDENLDLAEQIKPIYEWMNGMTNNNEEGIVIKPRKAFIKDIPPAFKVRNNNYLTMIYGVNFLQELDENIRKRSVGRKVECSINDWNINHRLLKIPYNEIHKENYYLKNLVFDRIMGENAAASLDTRL